MTCLNQTRRLHSSQAFKVLQSNNAARFSLTCLIKCPPNLRNISYLHVGYISSLQVIFFSYPLAQFPNAFNITGSRLCSQLVLMSASPCFLSWKSSGNVTQCIFYGWRIQQSWMNENWTGRRTFNISHANLNFAPSCTLNKDGRMGILCMKTRFSTQTELNSFVFLLSWEINLSWGLT